MKRNCYLQEQGVQDVVNINNITSEQYGDLIDQIYSEFNETLINNQDPRSKIENDETPALKHPNGNDSEDREINRTSAISNFMPKIFPHDEIAEGVNSLIQAKESS